MHLKTPIMTFLSTLPLALTTPNPVEKRATAYTACCTYSLPADVIMESRTSYRNYAVNLPGWGNSDSSKTPVTNTKKVQGSCAPGVEKGASANGEFSVTGWNCLPSYGAAHDTYVSFTSQVESVTFEDYLNTLNIGSFTCVESGLDRVTTEVIPACPGQQT